MKTQKEQHNAESCPHNKREQWETVSGAITLPSGYTLWTRINAGERIWTVRQTSEGEPSQGSGGYFSIETAIKVKGWKFTVKV